MPNKIPRRIELRPRTKKQTHAKGMDAKRKSQTGQRKNRNKKGKEEEEEEEREDKRKREKKAREKKRGNKKESQRQALEAGDGGRAALGRP